MANEETIRLNNLVKEIIDDAECHYGMKHIALRKSFYTGYGPMGCPKIKPERGMENNLYLTISYRNHDVTDMYDNVWIVIVECGICRWEKIATIKHNSPYYDKEMSQAEAYARMRQMCGNYTATDDDKAKLFNLIKNDAKIVYCDREDIIRPYIECNATTLGFFYVIKGIGVFITTSVQDRDWINYSWSLCVDLGLTNITVEELNKKIDNCRIENINIDSYRTISNSLKQTQSINITQNISGNGNTVVGISMTQTAKDDCDQAQSVVIRNSKSEKKKKDTIIGIFHQSLINLAKILEKASKYLLDHFMDD